MSTKKDNPFRLFVIGASAGGFRAVSQVIKELPTDINAAFMVVIHSSFGEPSRLAENLDRASNINVVSSEHNMPIEAGKVYFSIPNHHLFVENGVILHSHGPRENMFRPSIDVLFRSAAVAYGNQCVGVLLTGRLHDGTVGLNAIKRCGGISIIQNPETAEYPDMPTSAKDFVKIDYISDIEDMSNLILDIMKKDLPKPKEIPENIRRETTIAVSYKSDIKKENSIGEQVPMSCASCGGPLWKIKDNKIERYRCHVGHSFTQEALLKSQEVKVEETLWVCLRTLEEKQILLNRMVKEYNEKDMGTLAKSYEDKAGEVSEHIVRLRSLMQIQ